MIPARPVFVKQLDGSRYAGLNCTCAAAAMALDRETIGATRTTGARVRQLTRDTSGGTNLWQVNAALRDGWSVSLAIHTNAQFGWFEDQLRQGRGAILQGSSLATKGTRWQASETFAGNHAWYVNDVRGSGPETEFRVYDPLADGRRAGIATSPMWIPKDVVRRFAALLETTPGNRLGYGLVYAALTGDTEPHVHARFDGVRRTPFPDRTYANPPAGRRINVRSGPGRTFDIVDRLRAGDVFTAYQHTDTGESLQGSRRWFGDHNGRRWVHRSGLRAKGGDA